MSEYQYYEFQTVNGTLSADARKEMNSYSSRADVTSHSASYVYHYSSFPGDEEQLLAEYFDAFFYIANWGTVRLLFRFPKALIDLKAFEAYSIENGVQARPYKDYIILSLELDDEPFGWTEGEGYLSELIGLHNEILNGDMRAPYLVWLKNAALYYSYEYHEQLDEELIEPPVPPGLNSLTPALRTLCEVFRIEDALLGAAARNSPAQQQHPEIDYEALLSKLDDKEKDRYLRQLLNDEPNTGHRLKKELAERFELQTDPTGHDTDLRHISEIVDLSKTVKKEQEEQARREAEQKYQQKLDKIARKIPETWEKIHSLIAEQRAKPYDEATELLVNLRDLARRDGWSDDFQKELDNIHAMLSDTSAMKRRLKEKNLMPSNSSDE